MTKPYVTIGITAQLAQNKPWNNNMERKSEKQLKRNTEGILVHFRLS